MSKHKTKNITAALLTCMIMAGMTIYATKKPLAFIDESLMTELEEHVTRQNVSLSESEIKTLAQALYQEKYIDEPPISPAEEQAGVVDVAYENTLSCQSSVVNRALIALWCWSECCRSYSSFGRKKRRMVYNLLFHAPLRCDFNIKLFCRLR